MQKELEYAENAKKIERIGKKNCLKMCSHMGTLGGNG